MQEEDNMSLKMDDIAKMANVSRSAVSLALNGKEGISQATREKIFKIINKEGYKPLRKSKNGNSHQLSKICLLVISNKDGLVNSNYRSLPFFDRLVSSISISVSNFGGSLQIETIDISEIESGINKLVEDGKVLPTIVLGTDLHAKDIGIIQTKLPDVVFVDTYFPEISADFVTMDNYQGAHSAAKLILSKGYKNIGYVASNKWISNFQERRRGFYQALFEVGMDVAPEHFYTISPTKLTPDKDELPEMLKDKLPEALFCEDDYIAIRLIKECTNHGIKIPEKVAIMGFDDIYGGTLVMPELTTIHVPIDQIVNQALHQLKTKVAWPKKWQPQKCLVATCVVERSSL